LPSNQPAGDFHRLLIGDHFSPFTGNSTSLTQPFSGLVVGDSNKKDAELDLSINYEGLIKAYELLDLDDEKMLVIRDAISDCLKVHLHNINLKKKTLQMERASLDAELALSVKQKIHDDELLACKSEINDLKEQISIDLAQRLTVERGEI